MFLTCRRTHFPHLHHTDSITSHFTDLREVLSPHLDLLLHKLLPVESFILQPFLRLLPPPPLFLQHLTASQTLSLLEDSVFIKYFFDPCWSCAGSTCSSSLQPELSLTFIHLCTSLPAESCRPPRGSTALFQSELSAIWRSNVDSSTCN